MSLLSAFAETEGADSVPGCGCALLFTAHAEGTDV